MKTPHHPDLGASLRDSRSGLRDSHRRSLMRLLFIATGSALLVFACLQLISGVYWLAGLELLASGVLLAGTRRIDRTPHLQWWIYSYLVALFSFFLMIMLVPDASVAAFVWVLMMPVLAYLLLGKREGLWLSLPFMTAGGISYYLYLGTVGDARIMIDLLNMVLCGVLMLVFIHLYENRREEAEEKLVTIAQTDALTGLGNRGSFQAILNRTLAECRRSRTGFALVLMDIDYFKQVNDTLGHEAGDQVLRHIGDCLTERLRATDSVGRLGGEEFGLILRDVHGEDAFELIDELRESIAGSELSYGASSVRITASFGIACWPADGATVDDLFRVADHCLYRGKHSGRNTVARPASPVVHNSALAG